MTINPLITMCFGISVNDREHRVCRNLKYESLVLEGGGLKGLAYVGAMKALAEHGYYANNIWQFKNISGTSVGCLFGFFTALDISPENLRNIAMRTNFTELFHPNVHSVLDVPAKTHESNTIFGKITYFCRLLDYVRRVFNVWYHNDAPGVSDGREITQWIMFNIMKYSPYKHIINLDTTFAEFEDITQHSLTCYATKISSKKEASTRTTSSTTTTTTTTNTNNVAPMTTALMELSARTAPRQRIINIIYSSMTLPILFKPLTDKAGDTLLDGGLILNFPIYQQDWHDRKNPKVLGLSLHRKPTNDNAIVDASRSFDYYSDVNRYSTINTFNYLRKLVSVVTSLKSYILYSNDPRNCDRVVYLNSQEISMIDLKITPKRIVKTIDEAYRQTMSFMKSSRITDDHCTFTRKASSSILRQAYFDNYAVEL